MTKYKLNNGVGVVLDSMPYMRSVSIGVFIKCGSAYETRENNGISHFIEHLLFKGTQTRSADDISRESDELGGSLNAYTAEDCICVYVKVLSRDLKQALELLCDIVTDPVFDDAAIENEKKVISEEISSAEDNPEDAAQELLMAGMFRNHSVGMPVLGSIDNVNAFDSGCVRNFYQRHFVPENIVISLAGNFDDTEVKEYIKNSSFANMKAELPVDEAMHDNTITGGLYKLQRDTEQLQLVAGYPCVSRYDGRLYAFALLAGILGGDGSSRLFKRLREDNGLVYSVDASVAEYQNMGVFVINTGFSPENADIVKNIISYEINDIMNNGVTEEELLRSKKNIITALELEEESTMSMMSINGKRAVFDINKSFEDVVDCYNKVTNDDIIKVAKYAFSDKNLEAVALVGNCEKTERYSFIE